MASAGGTGAPSGGRAGGGARPQSAGMNYVEEWTNSEQNAPTSVLDMGETLPIGSGQEAGTYAINEPITDMMQAVMVHAVKEGKAVRVLITYYDNVLIYLYMMYLIIY